MKTKIVAIVLAVAGILIAWWGISTLLYYRSFTETAQGVVDRRVGNEVIIRFHEERHTPAPQKVEFRGVEEHAFPDNERTQPMKVGDKVEGYYPAGRLHEFRLDRDFSYWLPNATIAAGVILIIAGGATFFLSSRKKVL